MLYAVSDIMRLRDMLRHEPYHCTLGFVASYTHAKVALIKTHGFLLRRLARGATQTRLHLVIHGPGPFSTQETLLLFYRACLVLNAIQRLRPCIRRPLEQINSQYVSRNY